MQNLTLERQIATLARYGLGFGHGVTQDDLTNDEYTRAVFTDAPYTALIARYCQEVSRKKPSRICARVARLEDEEFEEPEACLGLAGTLLRIAGQGAEANRVNFSLYMSDDAEPLGVRIDLPGSGEPAILNFPRNNKLAALVSGVNLLLGQAGSTDRIFCLFRDGPGGYYVGLDEAMLVPFMAETGIRSPELQVAGVVSR